MNALVYALCLCFPLECLALWSGAFLLYCCRATSWRRVWSLRTEKMQLNRSKIVDGGILIYRENAFLLTLKKCYCALIYIADN